MSAQDNDDQKASPSGGFMLTPPPTTFTFRKLNSPTTARGKKRRRNQSETASPSPTPFSFGKPSTFSFLSPVREPANRDASNGNDARSQDKTNGFTFDPPVWSSLSCEPVFDGPKLFSSSSQSQSQQDSQDPKLFSFRWNADDMKQNEESNQNQNGNANASPSRPSALEVSNPVNFKFTDTTSKIKAERKVKLPEFGNKSKIDRELSIVQGEIDRMRVELIKLESNADLLRSRQMAVEAEITSWTESYAKWNADDFIEWMFQIDKGYFDMKCKINRSVFDRRTFCETLNQIANRFGFGTALFEGKHLEIFDMLDVQQLFPFLDGGDCRKLFVEIEKLTRLERSKNRMDTMCSICATNKKQYALSCGHIYCKSCIDRMGRCAFCKKAVNKRTMIKIFL